MESRTLFFYILAIVFLSSCYVPSPHTFSAHSERFYLKYKDYIPEGEQITASWYHYVKTKTAQGDFVVRTFYPETRQITAEIPLNKLNVQDGEQVAVKYTIPIRFKIQH